MPENVDVADGTVQQTPESGLRFNRIWWLREQEAGHIPPDPEWQLYSDLLLDFEGGVDPGIERVDGLGDMDAVHFSSTVEENEIMVSYALQRPIVDETGQPLDPSADALLRDLANQIPNTHSMIARDEAPTPGPDDPEGCAGQRMYLVMKGGKADITMEPDSEEAQPTPVELTYSTEKVRSYHFYQPDGPSTLTVYSESEEDTTQTVTVENEGGSESEELELDGTTEVVGTVEFEDIDAISLDEETSGDVHVEVDAGGEITVIRGSSYYADDEGDVEGDLGVPALGAGTAEEEIGAVYEDFHGDRVERPEGVRIAPDLNNITLEVENNLEVMPRQDTSRMRVHEGNRDISIEADVVGERVSHDMIEQAFANEGLDLEWELSRSLFTFPNATVTEPPARTRGADDTFADISTTFQSRGLRIEQP